MNVSEQHSMPKPVDMVIELQKKNTVELANNCIADLRIGTKVIINDLEVLDAVLNKLTKLERHCVQMQSLTKTLTVPMVERLRFERGLDPRPI